MDVRVSRVYDPPDLEDGIRILVDRLWPRGLRREEARVDEWLKELAPSDQLRRWFGHDPDRWEEFRARYWEELPQHPEAVARLCSLAQKQRVTLLFAARDSHHNNAVALAEYLRRCLHGHAPGAMRRPWPETSRATVKARRKEVPADRCHSSKPQQANKTPGRQKRSQGGPGSF
jgi:uncharacterized protein YeaO (DUF488 family)